MPGVPLALRRRFCMIGWTVRRLVITRLGMQIRIELGEPLLIAGECLDRHWAVEEHRQNGNRCCSSNRFNQ